MKVRKLTEHGLNEFDRHISRLRAGEKEPSPNHLLSSPEGSEELPLDLEVGVKHFTSRYEMGVYLSDLFSGQNVQKYMGDPGFWSWFALLWFDQLCSTTNGVRKPNLNYNYILSSKYTHRPRHAIYMTWQLVEKYRETSAYLLCKDMSTRGDLTEQMMSVQEVFSCEGVIQLGEILYYDPNSKGQKKGAGGKGPGSARRFLNWLNQLKLTYDLFSINAEDLEKLLPAEFDRFRE